MEDELKEQINELLSLVNEYGSICKKRYKPQDVKEYSWRIDADGTSYYENASCAWFALQKLSFKRSQALMLPMTEITIRRIDDDCV